MELKTIIHEPAYEKILGHLTKVAEQQNYIFAQPTPIISPFWKTTFTPSSSEVIFRCLENESMFSRQIYTVQPCIRINDLPHLGDGWHCLLFHMISFFLLDIIGFEEAIPILINIIISATNLKLENLYFTVSTNPYCQNSVSKKALGFDLLQNLGISSEHIILCAGADNYQNSSLVTADDQRIAMIGPKIEIFAMLPHTKKLYEVATCVLETAYQGERSLGDVFACAIGLERLAALSDGKISIVELQHHQYFTDMLCSSLLHPSMAKSSLGKNAVAQMILMIDALAYILHNKKSDEKYDRGIINHHRRVVRELIRLLKATGISLKNFERISDDLLNENILSSIDFLDQKFISEILLDYV